MTTTTTAQGPDLRELVAAAEADVAILRSWIEKGWGKIDRLVELLVDAQADLDRLLDEVLASV